jgi:hypothetical protein
MQVMNRSWLAAVLLLPGLAGNTAYAAAQELAGHWACPAELRLAAVGQNALTLALSTRSRLHPEGGYSSEGEGVVQFGPWPLPLAATSRGQWLRDGEHLTITVEALQLSPATATATELQRQMIRQLEPMLPRLPYTQTARIIGETRSGLVLEDEFGERYTCSRL